MDIQALPSRLCRASRYLFIDGASSSGKTQVFGTCIRRFESSRPSLLYLIPSLSVPVWRLQGRKPLCVRKVTNHDGLATLHRACESPTGTGDLPVSGYRVGLH